MGIQYSGLWKISFKFRMMPKGLWIKETPIMRGSLVTMKTVGMGLIGTGLWGGMHARTFADTPGVELRGVADIALEKAAVLAESHGATAYDNHLALLEDEGIDAVSVVTPDFAHEEILIDAAKAGKHILAEKPLATTVAACERVLAAVEEAGVSLMVDFHARWSPPLYKAREAVQAGEIGCPQHVYYRLNDRVFVPTEMLQWAGRSTVMWFVGSHAIDTLRWLLDDEVARVYSVARKNVLQSQGIDTPDYYLSTLEFRKGATAVLENSWILPNTIPNMVDVKCELVGDKGAIYVDQSHNRALEKYTETEGAYPDIFVLPSVYGKQQGFAAESIRHFTECIREGREPMVTGRDGLEVTKVICAIEESVGSGQPVDLE
jgi:predicted dehydrogenase